MNASTLTSHLDHVADMCAEVNLPVDPFAGADLLKALGRVDTAVLALGRRIAADNAELREVWAGIYQPDPGTTPQPPPPPADPPKPQPQPKPPPPPPPPPTKPAK